MWREGPAGFEPYVRVSWFQLRLAALLVLVSISLVMASALTLVSILVIIFLYMRKKITHPKTTSRYVCGTPNTSSSESGGDIIIKESWSHSSIV